MKVNSAKIIHVQLTEVFRHWLYVYINMISINKIIAKFGNSFATNIKK